VNKQLVAALIGAGCPAVGISGVDGGMIKARPLSSEMKFTGKPIAAEGKLLHTLIKKGFLPVVACIAGDAQGNIYNVNADQLAVSCAAGWGADKLFFLTDVPGVKDNSGETIAHLNPSDVRKLISAGIARGGMQAKLESSVWALESGLKQVIIAPGQREGICQDLIEGRIRGTSISLQKV
jgi:acetylglutamate kinase